MRRLIAENRRCRSSPSGSGEFECNRDVSPATDYPRSGNPHLVVQVAEVSVIFSTVIGIS